MAIDLHITDETSTLDLVILGIGQDISGPASDEPRSRFHLELSSYPTQDDLLEAIQSLEDLLIRNGVKVLRPLNHKNMFQIFVRDLGFVIGDEFYISSLSSARKDELNGIRYIIDWFDKQKVIDTNVAEGIKLEGGDVVMWKDTVFVGASERTNHAGFEFLQKRLKGKWKVKQVEIMVDNTDHRNHALHLDCVFQPLGDHYAIVYEEGIKDLNGFYTALDIPHTHIFNADKDQFVRMYPNILSLSKNLVVIEKEFIELKYWLLDRGFNVLEVHYREMAKLSGLLRCSTLPLARR